MPAMTGPDNQDKDKDVEDVVFEGEDEVQDKAADSAQGKGQGGDDDDDRRVVRGEGADDAEERRQRNRDSRRQRKERHRKLWERNRELEIQNQGFQKALGELNARLATIEEGSVEGVGRRIDASIAGAERAMAAAKDRLKRAMADQDADAVVAANEEIAQITVDRQRMHDDKRIFEERRAQAKEPVRDQDDAGAADDGQTKRRVEFEKTILRNASIFQRRNAWYDHNDDDDDTRVVKKLDAEVAAEGYNPAEKAYWEELEARMKEELPHRFEGKAKGAARVDDDDDDGGDRKVISMGSGRDSRHSKSGNGEYRLSRDRVQAIKDAGMWDDPVERKKMVDSYKKWDREHSQKKGA